MALTRHLSWLLVFLVAVACASPVSAVKLVVATHINDAASVEPQIALMKRFEELYPDVEIEVWYTAWDGYHDSLVTMFLAGIGPDVLTVGRAQFASFVEAGFIRPLDTFIAADDELDVARDVIPGFMNSGIYKGQTYGFPVYNGPALLFYNPYRFTERGVAEPVEYVLQDRWDRDTFVEVAKKLTYDTSGDGVPDQYGYFGYTVWQAMWVPYIRHAGGDVITADGRSGLNLPETLDGLRWLNNLNSQHGVTVHPGPGNASWESGNIAMHIRWQAEGLQEKQRLVNVDPEPAPIPRGPTGYSHLVGGVPVAVSAFTRHPEVAYEFAKWFAMESGIWQVRGGPPLSWEALRGEEYLSSLSHFRHPQMFEVPLLGDARPEATFGVVEYAEVNRILDEVLITPIRNGERTVEAAAEEAHRLLEQLLAESQ